MSLINLFVAARSALTQRRQRLRAYDELMALDDRSLVDGFDRTGGPERDAVVASAFGRGGPELAAGHRWMPPI